mmetsp:Transcript_13296/g.21768  ORF Transcript_13296/g.21768 Transcript_13296/m.21768 type:complete len:271 (-) Transcript_13296:207-1019(-)
MSDPYQKITTTENTILGVVAGTIEVTILQPMLYCKNASQQSLPFTLDPRKLYRGLAVSIFNMSVLTGIQFPLFGMISNAFTRGENRKLTSVEQISAGFFGGAMSGFACAPMELVLIQQQKFGGSVFSTPATLVSKYGASSMFRGFVTSCGREGIFTAGYMGIGPTITNYFHESQGLSLINSKVVGAVIGGVISATLSHPIDTVKTCMQGDAERKTYTTVTKTVQTLLQDGGAKRFFRGWNWRTGRMICAICIMSECKIRLGPLLFAHHFE